MNEKQKHRRKIRLLTAFICFLSVLAIVLMTAFELQARPIITEVAASQAENMVNTAVENAIVKVVEENDITYSSLVDVEKDNSGRITAVKADTVQMNVLKSKISAEVSEKILELDSREIQIPIGTIVGVSFLSGKGPKIKTRVTLSSNLNLKINNNFSSAGINQTLHEIIVDIRASVFVIMPRSKTTAEVNTNFCIAQTVIIGTVPETFADLNKIG